MLNRHANHSCSVPEAPQLGARTRPIIAFSLFCLSPSAYTKDMLLQNRFFQKTAKTGQH